MKDLFIDLEADDLLENVTKLHSLVIRDVDTDEILASCAVNTGYDSFEKGLKLLESADRIYAHNLIRYDRPALDKLTGFKIPWEKVRDTFVIAGMRWTNLKELDAPMVRKGLLSPKLMGKHSLEAWGHRLGILKGTYRPDSSDADRFKVWTPEMQTYCEQDTKVGAALVRHIRKAGATPALAIETEQELCAYLDEQEQFGWPFDMDKAVALQGKLAARRQQLEEELRALFGCWYKPKGEIVPKKDNRKQGYVAGCPATRVELVQFNPGSRQHIAERLQKLYGWVPKSFTPSGQPEVNEETLSGVPQDTPGVRLLLEYLLVVKRLGQLAEGANAWLKVATKDRPRGGKQTGMYHVHGACLQSGTVTHRAAHIQPNIAQVPAVGAPFGQECRELFRVPEGWVEVGADASGLELRKLSHYMAPWDGGAYGRTVIEGKQEDATDIHSVNMRALGLSGKKGRSDSKRFI